MRVVGGEWCVEGKRSRHQPSTPFTRSGRSATHLGTLLVCHKWASKSVLWLQNGESKRKAGRWKCRLFPEVATCLQCKAKQV